MEHILVEILVETRPSFSPPESFEIFYRYDKLAKAPGLHFKFSLCPDNESMHSENGRIQLSDAQYQRVMELLKKIKIGVLPSDDNLGLDGTTTRVGMIQGNNKIQLEWWEEAPIE